MSSINKVNKDEVAEVYPCKVVGITSSAMAGMSLSMSPDDVKSFFCTLEKEGNLTLITNTLQALSQRSDGTRLMTAFPSISEVYRVIDGGSKAFTESLLIALSFWKVAGANEISFDFVELDLRK